MREFIANGFSLLDAGRFTKRPSPKPLSDDQPVLQAGRAPRVLLVDDDPTFGKIIERTAKANAIPIAYCKSIDDFSQMNDWNYDVVIMDYDLGAVTGFELTSYLEKFTEDEVPVILVSQTKQLDERVWPETIKGFIHKGEGPKRILAAACQIYEVKLNRERAARKLGRQG